MNTPLSRHHNCRCSQYTTGRYPSTCATRIKPEQMFRNPLYSPPHCHIRRVFVIIRNMKKNVTIPSVFLAGPPCSGKSSTGYLLAEELGFAFCDLDKRIEKLNKTEILHIFRKYGESRFRQIESRALISYLDTSKDNFVMALGGGCLLQERNLSIVRKRGIIITLYAPTEVLLERLDTQRTSRPLAPSSESMKALLNKRKEHYTALPNRFDTSKTDPQETAKKIAEFLRKKTT
mgnify:CR=1 FL=1